MTTNCLFVSLAFFKTLQKWNCLKKPLEMLRSLQRRDTVSGNSPSLSCSQVWTETLCLICIPRLYSHPPLPFFLSRFFLFDSFAYFCPLFCGEGIEGRKVISSQQCHVTIFTDRKRGKKKNYLILLYSFYIAACKRQS